MAPVTLQLRYKILAPDVELPTKAYGDPVGWDLCAHCISETGRAMQAIVPPRTSKAISTKLVLLPPPGFFIAICSRSGMATNSVFVANSPGIVDPDYTGEVKVILYNGGHESAYIKHGQRIAQAILLPYVRSELVAITEVPSTVRGEKGFGSTDNPDAAPVLP